ncbi:MAG: hypothetical protein RRC34_03865 [Lentisphaeria bacterium]|nr:hypothetical protein [Lentisphaeria bacterium]
MKLKIIPDKKEDGAWKYKIQNSIITPETDDALWLRYVANDSEHLYRALTFGADKERVTITGQLSPPGGGNGPGGGGGKTNFIVRVPDIDIDIDSDNDNGTGDPELDDVEDRIEAADGRSGKIIAVNGGDSDGNGVPAYADWNSNGHFTPVLITLAENVVLSAAEITIDYKAVTPGQVTFDTQTNTWNIDGNGYVRLWTKNGETPRNPGDRATGGDFVKPGIYTPARLGFDDSQGGRQKRFFLESVRSFSRESVSVTLTTGGKSVTDAVVVSVGDIDLDIDSYNIKGFELPLTDDPVEDIAEDAIEADIGKSGKIILVNDNDTDEDWIPDWADGYSYRDDMPELQSVQDEGFVPVILNMKTLGDAAADIDLVFSYPAADPNKENLFNSLLTPDGDYEYYADLSAYDPETEKLRLWTVDGAVERDGKPVNAENEENSGHFVPADERIPLGKLPFTNGKVTLFLEAVNPYGTQITARAIPKGSTGTDWEALTLASDTVTVTPIKVEVVPVLTDDDGNVALDAEGNPQLDTPLVDYDTLSTYCPLPGEERGDLSVETVTSILGSQEKQEINISLQEADDGQTAVFYMTHPVEARGESWNMETAVPETAGNIAFEFQSDTTGDPARYVKVERAPQVSPDNDRLYDFKVTMKDGYFTGNDDVQTIETYVFSTDGGSFANYQFLGPREDIGLPPLSDRNAFVLKITGVNPDIENPALQAGLTDEDEENEKQADFSYTVGNELYTDIIIPTVIFDPDDDLGTKSSGRTVQRLDYDGMRNGLPVPTGVTKAEIRLDTKVESAGRLYQKRLNRARNDTARKAQIKKGFLVTFVHSNEDDADDQKSSIDKVSSDILRMGYGMTLAVTPEISRLQKILPMHSHWLHAGHGSAKWGLMTIKMDGSDYKPAYFNAADVPDDLNYDLVIMSACRSTNELYEFIVDENDPFEKEGNYQLIDADNPAYEKKAVLEIGEKLNASNYVGWGCDVPRKLSYAAEKLVINYLALGKTIKNAVSDAKIQMSKMSEFRNDRDIKAIRYLTLISQETTEPDAIKNEDKTYRLK